MLERLSQTNEQLSGEQVIDIMKSIVRQPDRIIELNERLAEALSPAELKAVAKPEFKDAILPIRFQDGKLPPTEITGSYRWANDQGALLLRDGFRSGWRIHVLGSDSREQVDLEVIYPEQL